ncbi:MAG: OmpH family outer membrane protein [Saprospiraceae bacterium]|nr:OmpH family outer membrane protein [Saprospiraceae bacterium]
MKNINWILHAVSLVAIAFLLYKNVNQSSSATNKHVQEDNNTNVDSNSLAGGYPIAYFLSDSLLANLDFFKASEEEFKKKQENMMGEVKAKENALQKEFQKLQDNAPNLTRNELEQGQQKLAKMEQDLLMRRENLAGQLAEETAEFNEKLHNKISAYLKEMNTDGRYKFVFSVQREGNIFYADSALDITKQMIQALNEKYGK